MSKEGAMVKVKVTSSDFELSFEAMNIQQSNVSSTKEVMVQKSTERISVVMSILMYIKSNDTNHQKGKGSKEGWDLSRITSSKRLHSYVPEMDVKLVERNRVNIDTLARNVDKPMIGKFFLCRTITPCSKIVAVNTAVEDPEGVKAVGLALRNFSAMAKIGVTDFNEVLPLGALLILKNPWFKSTASGGFILRCDNPADIEVISPRRMEKLFPGLEWRGEMPHVLVSQKCEFFWDSVLSVKNDKITAITLKTLGNKSFVQNRITDAIRWYDLGLDYATEKKDIVEFLSNKALTLLHFGCYNAVLVCTDSILEMERSHLKAIFRRVKALAGLKRYQEAKNWLEDKFKEDEGLRDNQYLKLLNRNLPSAEGPPPQTDLTHLLRCDMLNLPLDLDKIPEYISPLLEIRHISRKMGRGLFATKAIAEGTLLMISKAFASAQSTIPPETHEDQVAISFTVGGESANMQPGQDVVVDIIANKLNLDPSLGPELYKLWAGAELHGEPLEADALHKVDMVRIDRIVSLNTFGFIRERYANYGDKDNDNSQEEEELRAKTGMGYGLWFEPSLINHSCSEANAFFYTIRDMKWLRAYKPIKKGQEILISYVPGDCTYKSRQMMLKAHEFKCICRLCKMDTSEIQNVISLRESTLKRIGSTPVDEFKMHPSKLRRGLEDLLKLESLRKDAPELNMTMIHSSVMLKLCPALDDLKRTSDLVQILKKSYRVSSHFTLFARIRCFQAVNILTCYMELKIEQEIKEWVEEVKRAHLIVYGTTELLKTGNPRLFEDLAAIGVGFDA